MKHKIWLFASISVLAVIFGMSFPGIMAIIEDQSANDVENQYKITNPQLTPTVTLPDVIRLISGKYTRVDLETGNALTKEEAYRHALKVIDFFKNDEALPFPKNGFDSYSAAPFLAVASDGSATVVLWQVSLYSKTERGEVNLVLDDSSGKMASCSFYMTDSLEAYDAAPNSGLSLSGTQIDHMAKLFADYFGFELTAVKIDNSNGKKEIYSGTAYYRDNTGATLSVPITCIENSFLFNFPFTYAYSDSLLF